MPLSCAPTKRIDEFVDLIDTYGSFEGLVIYNELLKSRFYRQIQSISERTVYIFQTGKYAENTFRLLHSWNLKIEEFLKIIKNRAGQVILFVVVIINKTRAIR
mgnify:CR=1 FL=1